MFPMKITSVVLFFAAALTLCMGGAWMALVPQTMTPGTFAWLAAVGLVATAAALRTASGAQPTRSIAHVLYDVENSDRKR